MISGEKILITGANSRVGEKLGEFLARDNEVWGLSRFSNPESKAVVERLGMRPVTVDLSNPDFSELPDDFDYVLHLAHTRRGPDEYVEAIEINAISAGLLFQHCRKAKALLVVSSTAVYSPPDDLFKPIAETAPIGRAWTPWGPSSPVSKVSLEAVARFCAPAFNLRTVIMRLNVLYGPDMAVLPVNNMDMIMRGDPVNVFADPYVHSPIHIDDMCDQLEALLDAASTHAEIVNWCGEEVWTQRQWCELVSAWSGKPFELVVKPIPGTPNGNVGDPSKRISITGPCKRAFEPSFEDIYDGRYGAAYPRIQ